MEFRPTLAQRRDARRFLAVMPGADEFFAFERLAADGEDYEPEFYDP